MTRDRIDEFDRLLDALDDGDDLAADALTDPELARLVAPLRRLSQLSTPAPATTDFPQALAGRLAQALRDQPYEPATHADQPSEQPTNDPAGWTDQVPDTSRPGGGWPRQLVEIAATAAVLVLVAGILIVALGGDHERADRPALGGQPGWATPVGSTAVPERSVFEQDPVAQAAREQGRGRDLDLTQQAHQFTVSLDWVGADHNRIMLAYTITGPEDRVFSTLSFDGSPLRTIDGTSLPAVSGVVSGVPGRTEHWLMWWDASVIARETGDLTLELDMPGLRAVEMVPPGGTPVAYTLRIATPEAEPDLPDLPEHRTYVPGPFQFTFTVPLTPGWQTPATAGSPQRTLEEAKEAVRSFLGDPSASLEGKLVDVPTGFSNYPMPTDPSVKRYVLTRPGQPGQEADVFVVDAETGTVLEAVLPSRAAMKPGVDQLSDAEATRIAEEFARQQVADLDRYQLAQRVIYPLLGWARSPIGDPRLRLPSDVVFVHWQRSEAIEGQPKEWPTVVIGVDRSNGQVVSYQIGNSFGLIQQPANPR